MVRTFLLLLFVLRWHSSEVYAANMGAVQPPSEHNFESISKEPGAVMFTPPKNWHIADQNSLPDHVRVMVVGKSSYAFPPSINLSTEEFAGSLKDYLGIVKEINASQGAEWKNLGSINTKAGKASLSQADTQTEWGPVRMMHVILLRKGVIYILTAAALKKEFPKLYQTFFQSFKTLEIQEKQSNTANGFGGAQIKHLISYKEKML